MRVWVAHSIFVRDERHFFSISGSFLCPSLYPFLCDLSPYFDVGWPSLTFLSLCLLLNLFYSFISLHLIWLFFFSSCLIFDLGLAATLYSCLFDMSIPLSSFFMWGSLGPRLMMFSMHCISCMRGIGIMSLGSLSLVFYRFFHPKTLAYVMSCVLRPPWGHDFTLCLTAHTWAILEIGWRLFLIAWWMRSYDMIYTGAYLSYQWWIFGCDVIYTGMYPTHRWQFLLGWCFALRHSQFASSLGLWWIRSCGMTLHWSIAISKSTFIRDTITPLDILHWDTLHSSMVDFWDDGLFWDTFVSEIVHGRHSHSIISYGAWND